MIYKVIDRVLYAARKIGVAANNNLKEISYALRSVLTKRDNRSETDLLELSFPRLNLVNGKINIPPEIKEIKIDIGLSFNAPISASWTERLPDRMVFGFEPNPENVQEIVSGRNRVRGPQFKYLDPKYLGNRFVIFNAAVDIDHNTGRKFYMAAKDPGTSSFYRPKQFRVKKIVSVSSVRLSDFLDHIPWDRFPHIEHIKVDAQGNDLRILRGAGNYLKERTVFVTAESTAAGYYDFSHTEKELDAFMTENGFEIMKETVKGGDKTYVNSRFKELSKSLDYLM